MLRELAILTKENKSKFINTTLTAGLRLYFRNESWRGFGFPRECQLTEPTVSFLFKNSLLTCFRSHAMHTPAMTVNDKLFVFLTLEH